MTPGVPTADRPGTRRTDRLRAQLRRWVAPSLLVVGLVSAWEVVGRLTGVASYLLPLPSQVWTAFLESLPLLPGHVATTMAEALIGIAAGAITGVAVAVVVAASPLARRAINPLLVASQTIPMVVLAPLLVMWFGFGMASKVVVVALIVFFPVAISTVSGLAGADNERVELVRAMGGTRRQVLRVVLVPSALPAFFAGLRISSAYAVGGAVIAEWVGASSGLGIFITRSQTSFLVSRVFVAVAIVAVLSMALFWLVELAARLASPWRYVDDEEPS